MADYPTLSFEGDGRVSVDVNDLIASPQFQATLAAVREFAEQQSFQRSAPE